MQRFFRNPRAARLIKKANDLGAGGVSVAVGELADGLEVNLDNIPQKYAGLDGTELAISESQERMAVVVAPRDAQTFINLAAEENLECKPIAAVTAAGRLKMNWRGKTIVDLDRDFLNSGGLGEHARVEIPAPCGEKNYFSQIPPPAGGKLTDLKAAWLANLKDLNVCSQKGLIEMFDSTVGSGSVLLPLGGKHQDTPAEGMAARLPLLEGSTATASLVTFGFDPVLAKWSPFHGALYAVIEAVAKNVAMGGDYRTVRLSFQEYFGRPAKDPLRWGKPFSALLGALLAQKRLGIPAVGGKDSMSGTFNNHDVPPTLVAFAVNTAVANQIVSPEFKQAGSRVVLLSVPRDGAEIPDFGVLQRYFTLVRRLIQSGVVLAAHTVRRGGLAAALSKMSFGNRIGFEFAPAAINSAPGEKARLFNRSSSSPDSEELFFPAYGSIILEIRGDAELERLCGKNFCRLLGRTTGKEAIVVGDLVIGLEEALAHWQKPLEQIFPTGSPSPAGKPPPDYRVKKSFRKAGILCARPRVFIPVFPGTNCEYETAGAFEKAGARTDMLVFKNLNPAMVSRSISEMARRINDAQIIALPGGFSAGDEPGGTGKFITAVFLNPHIKEAVIKLLRQRDGLILGICNGFQALIKLGLVPYGEFRTQDTNSPTLSFNRIKRHVSRMVYTRVASVLSPWLAHLEPGDVHAVVISHGEGRFTAGDDELKRLFQQGQVATQYADLEGRPTGDILYNPNGSLGAVEGLTSPCGRVLGKMGHPERTGEQLAINVPGEKDQRIFEAGTAYFR